MSRYHGVLAAALEQSAMIARQRAQQAADLPDEERRKLYRTWFEDAWRRQNAGQFAPSYPDYLRGLTCGAIKKNGKPCRMTTLGVSGRCKFHGGASTGPRTEEGRARALENLKLGRLKRGKS